jgi:hypothetical protein
MSERSEAMIEKSESLIDLPGRAHIQKILRTHSNPAQALLELQQTCGLEYSGNIGENSLSFACLSL